MARRALRQIQSVRNQLTDTTLNSLNDTQTMYNCVILKSDLSVLMTQIYFVIGQADPQRSEVARNRIERFELNLDEIDCHNLGRRMALDIGYRALVAVNGAGPGAGVGYLAGPVGATLGAGAGALLALSSSLASLNLEEAARYSRPAMIAISREFEAMISDGGIIELLGE